MGDAGAGLATPPGIAVGMEAEETAGGMEFAGRRGADGGGGVGADVAIPMGTNCISSSAKRERGLSGATELGGTNGAEGEGITGPAVGAVGLGEAVETVA